MPRHPAPASSSPKPPLARIPAARKPGSAGLLTLLVGVVIILGLYFAREVLIPVTLAILLSFVLAPLVNLLRRLPIGRTAPVLLAVALALGVVLALGGLIGTQLADLAHQLPRYASTIQGKVTTLRGMTLGRFNALMRGAGRQLERESRGQRPAAPQDPAAEPPTPRDPKPLPVEVHPPDPTPWELTERVVGPIVGPLSTTAVVFIVAVFTLLQREDLRDRLIRLSGSGDLHRTTEAMDDAGNRLSRYFLMQLAINAGFGVIVGVGLFIIGVPSPVLWGVLAMLMRFVPYVGTLLSAVVPLALAAAVDPGWTKLAWTAGLYFVVEPTIGQAVEPLLYGHSTGLSPFAVIVAAIFWGWLWGPVGLLISTPLTLLMVVLGRHVERLEFLDVMLGDRPPLTPIESFYQRMLADNPDEAQEQAELLLKERSLSSYYDEVAVKGLQLAANDARRGRLGSRQLERIKSSIKQLVTELDAHPDADPRGRAQEPAKAAPAEEDTLDIPSQAEQSLPKSPAPRGETPDPTALPAPWRSAAPVLCVAGRGPLDQAAATMLAQLLGKHGLGARVLSYEAVAPEQIFSADLAGTALVCLSYLELRGSPSHLEYLVRRLRRRLPGVPVLVGLWPAEDPILDDLGLRTALGVDYFTSSLREAVEDCLDAARMAAREGTPANAAVDGHR